MPRFDCPLCEDEFEASADFRDHAWDVHGACHYCGEQFADEETLSVHRLAIHPDELSRAEHERAESSIGHLSFGDRLAHQGIGVALGNLGLRGAVFLGVSVFAVVLLLIFGGYAGGMIGMFVITTGLIALAKEETARQLRSLIPYVERASAALLIGAGGYMLYYYWQLVAL